MNLTKVQKQILEINNVKDPKTFLDNSLDLSKNILDLKGVKEAFDLIMDIGRESHILILTDYDADGITSAIVLTKYFKDISHYPNIKTIINKRINNNGINPILLEQVLKLHKEWRIDLIILADHGSSNENEFKILKENDIKIILTDHHTIPEDNYPISADVVINVQRKDCNYNKNISGCFVAFLLCYYIEDVLTFDALENLYSLIPFVAVSTISDVMSLKEPINRKIVNLGLNIINSRKYPKWNMLMKNFGMMTMMTYKDIGYKVAPLINSGNRTNTEDIIFEAMYEDDINIINDSVETLKAITDDRKKEQKRVMKSLSNIECSGKVCTAIIDSIYNINGIIANNLTGTFNKPVICFSSKLIDDEVYLTGSARSVGDIDLYKVINDIANKTDLIVKYGGHKQALGLTIKEKDYHKFMEILNTYDISNKETICDSSFPG